MKAIWLRILGLPNALWTIAKGLAVTILNFGRVLFGPLKRQWNWSKMTRSGVTLQYPEERWEPFPRFRGLLALTVDPKTGRERCVACGICASICPNKCITVERARGEEGEKEKPRPKRYEVDISLCLFCGLCVEQCPYNALTMTARYELADYDRAAFIYDKERLLKGG